MDKYYHNHIGYTNDYCPACEKIESMLTHEDSFKLGDHNHPMPLEKQWTKGDCDCCDAWYENLYPAEDGFYKFESDCQLFQSFYYHYWDEFEKEGHLRKYWTRYGDVIDN